ncbi:Signal transduction histidine kinase [Amycolatopsis arida]|uniref:histidine kinase n=1 Tax=Amycolatopsis arida TaxID=587909 RepID=A0A1I5Z144_9PSEU|nr:histidine kinase [Amycolatopsis arida]TDX90014.1 signal transduction histidine kinase [Amycolatopsis arida]SFQ49817.1 Signal transduction histidine kinase [Amycolatopsis arida]
MLLRRILRPVVDRSTYRRWTYLILGGALLVPYLLFAAIAAPSVLPLVTGPGAAFVIGGLLTVGVAFASSFLPVVRVLEGAAVRELLDDPVPGVPFGPARSWAVRLRSGVLFLLHVLIGGVVSLVSLVLPVLTVLGIAAPATGNLLPGVDDRFRVPTGWTGLWVPAVLVLALLALVYLVAACGAVLCRAAARLLRLPAADRIAELERQAGRLVERNRLARELHDSVGHALSVVTLQAGAARRLLDRDRTAADRALRAVEDAARGALDDLDHVLGLLREERDRAPTTPPAGLAELPALLDATTRAGLAIDAEVRAPDGVPPVVSREAYRIVQECLTNALRHAGDAPVSVRVGEVGEWLELVVRNPLPDGAGRRRGQGGRGLRGVAERVELLGGRLSAGPVNGEWEVAVRLPAGEWGSGA